MKAFEKNIRKVEPYVPGEQPQRKVVKLNTNENPYPPAPKVEEILRTFDAELLRKYPDPAAEVLVKALAEHTIRWVQIRCLSEWVPMMY